MSAQSLLGYLYIAMTVVWTVYGQMVLKWRLSLKGSPPAGAMNLIKFMAVALMDPWVVSSYVAALVASLFWMAALTRFELSFAYPFMSTAFVFVMLLGVLFFGETLTPARVVGTLLVVAGLMLSSR